MSCLMACALLVLAQVQQVPKAPEGYINYELNPVHPLALSPNGRLLAAANIAAHRVDFFSLDTDPPRHAYSVKTGLGPVSLRFRNDEELWVVAHLSDAINIIDVPSGRITRTLACDDEPTDIVFAGTPERAYVVCSQARSLMAFEPGNAESAPERVRLQCIEPRSLAVSPDKQTVYIASFLSGNGSTILSGDLAPRFQSLVPLVVNNPDGPHEGQNPPFNAPDGFIPPMNPELPPPPPTDLIVKQDSEGRWRDDTGADWTDFVSGERAAASGRPPGWKLLDHDIVRFDTKTGETRYTSGLMNIVMALDVNPATGEVLAVGTDGTNEIRFEPNLNGVFLRVLGAFVQSGADTPRKRADLNAAHLGDYANLNLPPAEREKSIGDPRAAVWNAAGDRAYIAGMGSDNIIIIDRDGVRVGAERIEVGSGPTGLALDEGRGRLYVLNGFENSISVVSLTEEKELGRVAYFNPTPEAIRAGRPHLYNTHESSGLGHIACASCHVDARVDGLAWDLGDPTGVMKSVEDRNLDLHIPVDQRAQYHPMKGPRTTQTLQGIIGHEPFHWSGDRDGIETFSAAFSHLHGDSHMLADDKMRELKAFLGSIVFPPNPHLNPDGSLSESVDLGGEIGSNGEPLPKGNAARGFTLFNPECLVCHIPPLGMSITQQKVNEQFEQVPIGPSGENHHRVLIAEQFIERQTALKVPSLRSVSKKTGFSTLQHESLRGFGLFHSGVLSDLGAFLGLLTMKHDSSVQDVADLFAMVLSISGSEWDIPIPPGFPGLELPTSYYDRHPAVGLERAYHGDKERESVDRLVALAEGSSKITLIITQSAQDPEAAASWRYEGGNRFTSDLGESDISLDRVLASATAEAPVLFLVVDREDGMRLSLDADSDGVYDGLERRAGTDPEDADSYPDLFALLRIPAQDEARLASALEDSPSMERR
ncbi:MAG: hypothetical protein GC168_03485 [Candidatus Hydrogenedens sp.]|nr:hypothetical protein [Candidatus Hydrogenedens sp.]